MSGQTIVLSAKFARKERDFHIPSDLEKSLFNLGFENAILFDHHRVLKSGRVEPLEGLANLNPMGIIPKVIREFLRRNNNLYIQGILTKYLGDFFSLMIPHNLRHFYYREILSGLNKSDFVFIVDSRDLIFQEDPRSVSKKLRELGNLHFFDERSYYLKNGYRQDIENSDATINWIRIYKEDLDYDISAYGKKWIINGGCFAGYVEDLQYFNDLACNTFMSNSMKLHEILDQAVVNCPIYEDLLSHLKIVLHANGDFVLNMCGVIEADMKCENGILEKNGAPIPIVHQYDRLGVFSKELGLKFLPGKYRYQNLC